MHRNGRTRIRLSKVDSITPLRFDRRTALLSQLGHKAGIVDLLFNTSAAHSRPTSGISAEFVTVICSELSLAMTGYLYRDGNN